MEYADKYICEKGTTVIGRKGTIDKPLFIETNFWNVDTAFGLIAGKSLTKEFLLYFCKSFNFKELDKGTTYLIFVDRLFLIFWFLFVDRLIG
jgi:type I restriction enzyme S subunit